MNFDLQCPCIVVNDNYTLKRSKIHLQAAWIVGNDKKEVEMEKQRYWCIYESCCTIKVKQNGIMVK